MPSSPSRQEPLRAPTTTDAPHARPQHHGIFLEPRYTVELPPLHETEGDEEPTMESLFERPQSRRRTPIQRRG